MKDLSKRNIDLQTYMIAIGANSLKYQPDIQTDPDPLADDDEFSDDENFESNNPDTELADVTEQSPVTTAPLVARPPPNPLPTIRAKKPAHKKGKRTKQKPVQEAETSMIHVESVVGNFAPHDSCGGEELREARRQQAEQDAEGSGSSLLT